MAQRLHLVFGGELVDPARTEFRDVNDIHIVGIFPDYDTVLSRSAAPCRRCCSTRPVLSSG